MTLTDALRMARRQDAEAIAQARARYDNERSKAKRIAEALREARRLRDEERRGCP